MMFFKSGRSLPCSVVAATHPKRTPGFVAILTVCAGTIAAQPLHNYHRLLRLTIIRSAYFSWAKAAQFFQVTGSCQDLNHRASILSRSLLPRPIHFYTL